jgi:exosome complex component CSL4
MAAVAGEKSASSRTVCPGELLGSVTDYDIAGGCYVVSGTNDIRSSLIGKVIVSEIGEGGSKKKILSVISSRSKTASEMVLDVGDRVLCRVLRTTLNQANVEIISVGDRALNQFPKGIIRREDIRLSDIDSVIVHECFRPGDIVIAAVISLGDSRQYYLSTADADLGVRFAKSQHSDKLLVPGSWKVRSLGAQRPFLYMPHSNLEPFEYNTLPELYHDHRSLYTSLANVCYMRCTQFKFIYNIGNGGPRYQGAGATKSCEALNLAPTGYALSLQFWFLSWLCRRFVL